MSKNPRQPADKKLPKVSKTKVNNNTSANDRKRNFITKLNQATSVSNAETFISQIKNVHYLADIDPSFEDDSLTATLLSSNKTKEDETNSDRILAEKLRTAETQLQNMKTVLTEAEHQIVLKNKEINELKRQAKIRSASKQPEKSSKDKIKYQNEAENSKYLHRKCTKLEKKVKDMESFLRDYGLIWVGHSCDDQNTRGRMIENYIEECFEQLMLNIAQLNAAAGKDEVVIERNEKGASFKTPTPVSLKFYKNGLVVQGGPLRQYQEPSTESFIRDILDGYFPSELQREYPNGVPFKVEDRRAESLFGKGFEFAGQGHKLKIMKTKKPSDCQRLLFENQDNKLSKATTSKCVKPVKSEVNDWSVIASSLSFPKSPCSDAHMRSHMNTEMNAYLLKVCSATGHVIKEYYKEIVRQRQHLKSEFQKHESTQLLRQILLQDMFKSPLVVYINEPSGKDGEFRLKIRSVNGCILYLVHVTADDTVNELYTLMNKTVPRDLRTKYKIVMSGLGSNKLDIRSWTLEQYGISKDCVLHLSSD